MSDGWDDDLENLDISDEENEIGWEEDDDLFGDNDDAALNVELKKTEEQGKIKDCNGIKNFDAGFPSADPLASVSQLRDDSKIGWDDDDDDDLFDDNVELESKQQDHRSDTMKTMQTQINDDQLTMDKISNYVNSLNRILSSINAVLEFEYNTIQKAEELVEYYRCRPQLAEYTRTKELQRMNYKVVLPHGHVETNKERILAENLLPDDSLVARAANQSLLADLLQVITGNDLIVQPQFFAICVASWCQFTIHVGDQGSDMVDCRGQLSLSLPTEQGDRLNIAEIFVSVIFSPTNTMVEFKVQKIEVLLQDSDYSKLAGVVEFINAMESHNEAPKMQELSADIYRDTFLKNSQRLISLSSKGMKSALMQMDSVCNIKGKLESVSNFIPGTDQLQAVEEEAIALAKARNQQSGQAFPQPPPRPTISNFLPGADELLAAEEEAKAFVKDRRRGPHQEVPRPAPPPRPGISDFILGADQLFAAEEEAKAFAEARKQSHQAFPRPSPSLRPNISNFIPGTDQLLAAEEETKAFAEAMKQQRHHQQQHSSHSIPPKSILGGLVRSGWNTLAKSVTPDDVRRPPPPPPPPPNTAEFCEGANSQKRIEKAFHDINDTYKNDEILVSLPSQDPRIPTTIIRTNIQSETSSNIFTSSPVEANGKPDVQLLTSSHKEKIQPQVHFGAGISDSNHKIEKDYFGFDDNTDEFEASKQSDDLSDNFSATVDSTPIVQEIIEMEYNPDDDIVETRKRWVNNSSLIALKYYVEA